MRLDVTALDDAIAQLEEAIEYRGSDLASRDPALKLHLRAAAIQAFEFTYELSFNMVKRHLEQVSPNPEELDRMSFKAIMREAFRRGLVQSEVSTWDQYRKLRGTTSHTYNAGKAQMVFESLPDFLREARFLRDQLQQRNESLDDPIDIRADHLRIVHDVLARHLPDGVRVWVFGSRATWKTKDSSDLDLALEGETEIPQRSLSALEVAFEESDLPYSVDIVDVRRIGSLLKQVWVGGIAPGRSVPSQEPPRSRPPLRSGDRARQAHAPTAGCASGVKRRVDGRDVIVQGGPQGP